MSIFRSPKNEIINEQVHAEYRKLYPVQAEETTFNGTKISIEKRYIGFANNVFQVNVHCDPDIVQYARYSKAHENEQNAINDFDRVIAAIQRHEPIRDEALTSGDGMYELTFVPSFNQHIIIQRDFKPYVCYAFDSRTEAKIHFDRCDNYGYHLYGGRKFETLYHPKYAKYLVIDRTVSPSDVHSYEVTDAAAAKAKYDQLVSENP